MTANDVRDLFNKHDDEHGKFERIDPADRLHPAKRLCGFLKLAAMMTDPSQWSVHAGRDEVFLAGVDELRPDVAESDMLYLMRCGIRWDGYNGCFSAFT